MLGFGRSIFVKKVKTSSCQLGSLANQGKDAVLSDDKSLDRKASSVEKIWSTLEGSRPGV